MSDINRREAVRSIAGGTLAGLTIGGTANAAPVPSAILQNTLREPLKPALYAAMSPGLLATVREQTERLAIPPVIGPGAVVGLAEVLAIRSWSREVYLHLSESCRGLVTLSEAGLAIVSACKAARRPVAACVWGHEPHFADIGRFTGVLVAMDLADLPAMPGLLNQL
jgi:hypothetical protein